MILSRWQLVLTLTLTFILTPSVRGEAIRPPGRRRACPTTRFDRVLLASHQLQVRRARRSRPTKKISCFPAFLIHSAFGRMSVIARSQVCRLEFRRRICAQYLPVSGCNRAMQDSSGRNPHAFQNRDNSAA